MTWAFVFVAVLNGAILSLNRVLNVRLAFSTNIFYSAFVNHLVGTLFLLCLILCFFPSNIPFVFTAQKIPFVLYLGGSIGVFSVIVSNWITPKLGVTKSTLFIICGNIVAGSVIDVISGKVSQPTAQMVGMMLIFVGMSIPYVKWKKRETQPTGPKEVSF